MDKQECIERQLESALLEGRWGVFERLRPSAASPRLSA